ncbi:hypothetical protein K439DRAFT_1610242 [Ramaria rubella]|nr:hypothetical protein K439DRAFT_1610242 [Ramaria rubella]
MGCDTSWQNKNENHAAVTFLTAVDQAGLVTPGSALLSANIKTETLVQYFEAMKAQVQKHVQEIVKDPSSIAHKSSEDQAEPASWIIENGWQVPKWMIDKCRAELKALKIAFPDAYIRICQFHIVQAILRWDCEDKTRGNVPRIPLSGAHPTAHIRNTIKSASASGAIGVPSDPPRYV